MESALEANRFLESTAREAFEDIKPILAHRDIESSIAPESARLTISGESAPMYWSYTLWVVDDHLYYEISHSDGPGGRYQESEQLGMETIDHINKQEIVSHILVKYRHFGFGPPEATSSE